MFFGNRSTVDAATRIDARHEADVKAWWRDWRRYLEAQLQLLHARQAEATQAPSFERSEQAWEEQRATAEQTLKRMPHERRVVFDREIEVRRAMVQGALEAKQRSNGAAHTGALDPEVVERETLTDLLAEAEGRADGQEAGIGVTPFFDRKYSLQVDALLHAPRAAEYSVAADAVADQRKRWALIAALLLGGMVVVWWTWPRGTEAAQGTAPRAVQVNGQAAQLWPVAGVTVIDADGARTSVPVTPTDALQWPDAARVAWWRRTASTPLEVCLPQDVLDRATALEVHAGGDLPTRIYALVADAPARRDLVLSACGAAADTPQRHGVLEDVRALPDQPLDQPVTLGQDGPRLRVHAITVIGAGQDPLVPPDTYRVVVRVTPLATGMSWAALDPRLVLQTGLDVLPSAPMSLEQGQDAVEVVYLVPAFTAPLEAAWSITDPQSKTQVRWRVILDPPPSRAAVLRDALELKVVGERGEAPGTGSIEIEVRNTGTTPLVLKRDDLAITQQDRTLPITEPGPAGMVIEPREVRTLALPLRGIDWTQDVRVRVGGMSFRLRF
ncbi:MAG: hypothetical protein M3380_05320 [Chloroflexota bacterium]|nr:hypothetical protein [Chloroflexota bacterium]